MSTIVERITEWCTRLKDRMDYVGASRFTTTWRDLFGETKVIVKTRIPVCHAFSMLHMKFSRSKNLLADRISIAQMRNSRENDRAPSRCHVELQ